MGWNRLRPISLKSKYQGQVLPEESRLSVDPEFDKNAKDLPIGEEVKVGS
jgi:hypothetical protein|tara:strand:+ start:246 stop:395 length:150 start_codon:yes stop_codon:yes gene_type:complete